ncbi:Uncharacterised protein [Klebsiella variicola]|nr:hypothetical protein [Klebsiella variicola]SLZ40083.1 Uncharacterised protein [Klebsiella variicola]
MDYLLMSYIALASCWPVTLILLSVAAVVLLHAERRVLNVSIIVLVGFLVFAAWQFMHTLLHIQSKKNSYLYQCINSLKPF